MRFRSKWTLIMVMLPTLILTIFGVWLFLIYQQEEAKTAATQHLLEDQFPIWERAVNEYVLNDASHTITPKEAAELVERQKNLKKDSLYLSVDSLIVRKTVQHDSVVYAYNYHQVAIEKRTLPMGSIINDAMYVVNSKKEVLGLQHNQTGYLLILQTALEVLNSGQKTAENRPKPQFFNANLSINDAIINQRLSMIGLDTTGKYLIQLASRMPDATYENHNNEIAIPQAVYQLLRWFLGFSWLLFLTTVVTFFLYRNIVRLSTRSQQLLNTLDKATCAIAIAEEDGNLNYVNDTYRQWNNNQSGQNLFEKGSYLRREAVVDSVVKQPGKTAHFNAVLGSKNVQSSITYDAATRSLIVIDTDVSALRNMYDGEFHSLKNLIQEVKELNARIILGELPISDHARVLQTLNNNNHTLEKAILFYENNRGALAGFNEQDLIHYDLELGLGGMVHWFDSLTIPLGIELLIEVPPLEVKATLNSIELVFHNAIFNAIQAIRAAGPRDGGHFIRVSAEQLDQEVYVSVADSGVSFPADWGNGSGSGIGISIIRGEMAKIGGRLQGIRNRSNDVTPGALSTEKSLQLVFQHV